MVRILEVVPMIGMSSKLLNQDGKYLQKTSNLFHIPGIEIVSKLCCSVFEVSNDIHTYSVSALIDP